MKNAEPYQPTWGRLWNSVVIHGMAVATMLFRSSSVTDHSEAGAVYQAYHVQRNLVRGEQMNQDLRYVVETYQKHTEHQCCHDQVERDATGILWVYPSKGSIACDSLFGEHTVA
jgi:hypothetical protein